MCRRNSCRTERALAAGFTLVELMVAIGIVVGVLATAYQILSSTLQAQRRLERMARPQKIGDAILSVIRRDLESAVCYGLGDRVFLGEDRGEGESAMDAIHFISTVEPTPTADEDYLGLPMSHLVSISYIVTENSLGDGLTLFRREGWEPEGSDLLDGGTYREVYNRLAYLNFEYMDADGDWFDSWDSQERADLMEIIDKGPEPIIGGGLKADEKSDTRDRSRRSSSKKSTERTTSSRVGRSVPIDPLAPAEEEEEEALPDPGIPKAVRVEFGIFVGDENGLWRDSEGNPLVYHFSGTVQILAAEMMEIRADLPSEAGGAGSGPLAGPGGSGGVEGIKSTGPAVTGPGRTGPTMPSPGRAVPTGPGGVRIPPGAIRGGVPKNLPAGFRK